MKKPSKQDNDQTAESEPLDKFGELIRVMDVEHLLRFRRRLEKVGRKRMVQILTYEIKAREALERKQDKERVAELEELRRKDQEAA
jgi:hypothetical protein